MPTITFIDTPDYLSPVNKEIWYVMNSGSSSLTDFKYRVTVNAKDEPFLTNTFTTLETYNLPPRPVTGYAEFSPNRILRSLFSYDFTPRGAGWIQVEEGLIQFYLQYGFQYSPNINYTATANYSGFMSLAVISDINEFEIGDIINVDKDNKQLNIQYDGTCSVTNKVLGYLITDKPYGATSAIVETGTITSLTRVVGTTSNAECYNGTRQYTENGLDFNGIYRVQFNKVYSFMTNWNMPYKTVYTGEYETLSTIMSATSGYRMVINTYDSQNNFIDYEYINMPTTEYKRFDLGVGPKNIELQVATTSFLNGVDNYEVYLEYLNWLNLKYHIIGATNSVSVVGATPSGTHNGRPYWTFTSVDGTFYFWYSSLNNWWEASTALGGGNSWLTSQDAGINEYPPDGTYSSQYIDGQDGPYFDEFTVTVGKRVTEIKKYKLKQNCSVYDPVRLMFLNREGGWDFFTFTLDSKRSINVDRTKYTKVLPYNYSIGMRGDTVLSQKVKPQYVITSNWITDAESEWLEELISSPEVYWLNGSDDLPIIITDTSYEVKTQLRNQTFNITLTFELAYNINIQNE